MRKSTNILGITLAMACSAVWATDPQDSRESNPASTYGKTIEDADNTGINERDDADTAVTAQTQSNDEGDVELLSTIRQEIVAEDTLSTSAHNIKIVTKDGAVTLRGPVNSAMEKRKVEELVQQITGVESVDNQLDVAASN